MMIPVGNEQNCLPSVGIATLNRRLKIDDALRATVRSCQFSDVIAVSDKKGF